MASVRTVNLIVAIHGILTDRADPTWPERLERYAAGRWPNTYVLTDHYNAGPLPWWNVWIKNPRAARSIAGVVENWIEDTDDQTRVVVHFVAHSNGCDIARRAVSILIERGFPVQSLIVFSAPIDRSLVKLGLRDHLNDGTLGRFVAYCADADDVLPRTLDWRYPWTYAGAAIRWPYGNLGRLGLSDGDAWVKGASIPITQAATTRMFPGWGHGDFFPAMNPGRRAATFAAIGHDMNLDPIPA